MVKRTEPQPPLRLGGVGKSEIRIQFGALCFRRVKEKDKKERIEVLLVSTRDTGRWIIPKGWPKDGETPASSAAIEAWEEAGVRGRVHEGCLGHFAYGKWIDEELTLPVVVGVFPLEVQRIDDDYPEARERKRKWLSPKRAARRVGEPDLRHLLETFDPGDLK